MIDGRICKRAGSLGFGLEIAYAYVICLDCLHIILQIRCIMLRLNRDQLTAITLLSSGMPATKVAASLGISNVTLSSWRRRNPQYRDALEYSLAEVAAGVRSRIPSLVDTAVDVLESIMRNETLAPDVRMRAIEMVLDKAIKISVPAGHARALTVESEPAAEEGGSVTAKLPVGGQAVIRYYAPMPAELPADGITVEAKGEEVDK